MDNRMNTEILTSLAYEVDDIVNDLIEKYQMKPLNVSAVVLARLMRLNQGNDAFIELVMEVVDGRKPFKPNLQ